jgi:hypothetical protein
VFFCFRFFTSSLDVDVDEEDSTLDYAINYFKRAGEGSKELMARAKVLKKHQFIWHKAKHIESWQEREEVCASAAIEFLDVGLVSEARALCALSSTDRTVEGLVNRLDRLNKKWRELAKDQANANM